MFKHVYILSVTLRGVEMEWVFLTCNSLGNNDIFESAENLSFDYNSCPISCTLISKTSFATEINHHMVYIYYNIVENTKQSFWVLINDKSY